MPLSRLNFKRYGKYIQHFAINLATLDSYDPDYPTANYSDRDAFLDTVRENFPNLTNFWIEGLSRSQPLPWLQHLPTFPLTRLAIDFPLLFNYIRSLQIVPKEGSTTPLFPGITHLHAHREPFNKAYEVESIRILATHFPNLTHLSLNTWMAYPYISGIRRILEVCNKLQQLLWWHSKASPVAPLGLDIEDSRIIPVLWNPIEFWQQGAKGQGLGITVEDSA